MQWRGGMGDRLVRVREVGEFALIDRLRAVVMREDRTVLVGIGDDAAVVRLDGSAVLTTDALVEGVHFRGDMIDARSTGYKALAASVSDVAAMGAAPRHALVTLAVPGEEEVERLVQIYEGMADACEQFEMTVIGGDVVGTSGPLVLSVTVTGELAGQQPLLRSGAQPTDLLFVTGDLGGAAAYVHLMDERPGVVLSDEDADALRERHQRPRPQVQAGAALARAGVCACANDVSDGLSSELHEIAEASGVRLVVDEERIPTPPALRHYARAVGLRAIDFALAGGEDYQLVGSVPRKEAGRLLALMEQIGVRVTLIGRAEEGEPGVELLTAHGRQPLARAGYDHFSGGPAHE